MFCDPRRDDLHGSIRVSISQQQDCRDRRGHSPYGGRERIRHAHDNGVKTEPNAEGEGNDGGGIGRAETRLSSGVGRADTCRRASIVRRLQSLHKSLNCVPD